MKLNLFTVYSGCYTRKYRPGIWHVHSCPSRPSEYWSQHLFLSAWPQAPPPLNHWGRGSGCIPPSSSTKRDWCRKTEWTRVARACKVFDYHWSNWLTGRYPYVMTHVTCLQHFDWSSGSPGTHTHHPVGESFGQNDEYLHNCDWRWPPVWRRLAGLCPWLVTEKENKKINEGKN